MNTKVGRGSKCILIAAPYSNSAISVQFRRLGDRLVTAGYQVVFLTTGQKTNLVPPQANPAIYTWPSIRPTKFADAVFLYRLIQQYRPVGVIGNFAANNLIALIGWVTGVPLRLLWHHTLLEAIRQDGMPKLKARYLVARKSLVFRAATDLVPVSQAGQQDLITHYGVAKSKTTVIYCSLPDPEHETDWKAIPVNGNRFVCVGRLDRSKGQDVLIRAMGKLATSHPGLRVVFLGDGGMKASYTRLAEELGVGENCHFVGQVSRASIFAYMRGAAATIVASRSEAFGLVNIESMALGTPVIAANTGGIPEIITNGQEGLLFEPGDAEGLADKIALILDRPDLREEMSQRARLTFLERFEINRSMQAQVD